MSIFWSFWIPFNFMFWWMMSAQVSKPEVIHFYVGTVFAVVTGIIPFLIWLFLRKIDG